MNIEELQFHLEYVAGSKLPNKTQLIQALQNEIAKIHLQQYLTWIDQLLKDK
jgi:hypothetical protein